LYPNPEYFQTWEKAQNQKKKKTDARFSGVNPDIVGITHTDADGYGCEVMLRKAYPQKDIVVLTAAEQGPHAIEKMGDYMINKIPSESKVFIMDLAPDSGRKFIDPFRHHNSEVNVIDHHEWEESDYNQIDWVADVYHNTDKCATQIMHDQFVDNPDDSITEFADLTADHDLWIKEDEERSDALSDLAYKANRDKYVKLALEYGVDAINVEEGRKIINKAQEIRKEKTNIALNRATYYKINDYNVAITYGQCNGSDVGSKLYEGEVDLACIIYPNGNVSFRSSDNSPVARKVALEMGGGGHKCAAGAKVDTVGKDVNYTTHWSTMGRSAREKVVTVCKETL
jgi:oligoribonuclease NrnB/cAMP/cGMP phosphodiesterase (DHH superfamily)